MFVSGVLWWFRGRNTKIYILQEKKKTKTKTKEKSTKSKTLILFPV